MSVRFNLQLCQRKSHLWEFSHQWCENVRFNSKFERWISQLWKISPSGCQRNWLIHNFLYTLTELITTMGILTPRVLKRQIWLEASTEKIPTIGKFTPGVWNASDLLLMRFGRTNSLVSKHKIEFELSTDKFTRKFHNQSVNASNLFTNTDALW